MVRNLLRHSIFELCVVQFGNEVGRWFEVSAVDMSEKPRALHIEARFYFRAFEIHVALKTGFVREKTNKAGSIEACVALKVFVIQV